MCRLNYQLKKEVASGCEFIGCTYCILTEKSVLAPGCFFTSFSRLLACVSFQGSHCSDVSKNKCASVLSSARLLYAFNFPETMRSKVFDEKKTFRQHFLGYFSSAVLN